jgi:hypothetical protein
MSSWEANPWVQISLTLSDAVVDIVEDSYDLALRMGQLPDSGLTARLLMRGARRVCASPAYWRRHGRPEHPRDLARHNCIVLVRPGAPQSSWQFQEDGRAFSVRVHGDRTANDGGAFRAWAIASAGVVLNFDNDIAQDLAACRLENRARRFRCWGREPSRGPHRRPTPIPTRRRAARLPRRTSRSRQVLTSGWDEMH